MSKNSDAIDFIVYWVDGSDPAWRAKKSRYAAAEGQDDSRGRYRDWDNLQYLFRGIERFAPWVNRVFFVSDGQLPPWLNVDHPKLKVVDHRDFIPEKWLPTFSANPIELNFHRIEGLSERFVVFNDDFFLTRPVSPEDFFRDGKPVDIFMEYPAMCGGNNPVFSHLLVNDFNAIGRHFSRGDYRRRLRGKILSPRYGAYFFYNLILYLLPYPRFFGLLTPHFCRPYLKSAYEQVWAEEPALLEATSRRRFRSGEDVNIYLIRIWNLMRGNFVPGNVFGMGRAFFIHDVDDAVCRAIERQKYRMICVNDDCDDGVYETMKRRVNASFGKILPQKSTFER